MKNKIKDRQQEMESRSFANGKRTKRHWEAGGDSERDIKKNEVMTYTCINSLW